MILHVILGIMSGQKVHRMQEIKCLEMQWILLSMEFFHTVDASLRATISGTRLEFSHARFFIYADLMRLARLRLHTRLTDYQFMMSLSLSRLQICTQCL